MGAGLTVPITNGRLNLGTWQGIWLCEHRWVGAGAQRGSSAWCFAGAQAGCPFRQTWPELLAGPSTRLVCAHRSDHGGRRRVVVTIQGET